MHTGFVSIVCICVCSFALQLPFASAHIVQGQPPAFISEIDAKIIDSNIFHVYNNVTSSLVLPCNVSGTPTPTISWFRQGSRISRIFIQNDGTLTFNASLGLDVTYSGVMYHCLATNSIGDNGYTATLRSRDINVSHTYFNGFRRDAVAIVQVFAIADASVALECDYFPASPPPIVEWFADDTMLANVPFRRSFDIFQQYSYVDNGQYLYIPRLRPQDLTKEYYCVVTNGFINNTRIRSPSTYTLDLQLLPGAYMEYKALGAKYADPEGETVIFLYVAAARELDGTILSPLLICGTVSSMSVAISNHIVIHVRITSIPAEKPALSTFGCLELSRSPLHFRQVVGAVLWYRPTTITSLPQRDSSYTQRELIEGRTGSIAFECNSTGYPEPTHVWYYNGEIITSGNGINVNTNYLTISEPLIRHSGIYQCFARNSYGSERLSQDMRAWSLEVRHPTELETRIEGRSGSKACLMENVAYACTVLESIHLWRINDFNLSIEVNSMPISHPPFVFTRGGPSLTLLNVTIFPSLNGTNIRCSANHFIRETIVRIEADPPPAPVLRVESGNDLETFVFTIFPSDPVLCILRYAINSTGNGTIISNYTVNSDLRGESLEPEPLELVQSGFDLCYTSYVFTAAPIALSGEGVVSEPVSSTVEFLSPFLTTTTNGLTVTIRWQGSRIASTTQYRAIVQRDSFGNEDCSVAVAIVDNTDIRSAQDVLGCIYNKRRVTYCLQFVTDGCRSRNAFTATTALPGLISVQILESDVFLRTGVISLQLNVLEECTDSESLSIRATVSTDPGIIIDTQMAPYSDGLISFNPVRDTGVYTCTTVVLDARSQIIDTFSTLCAETATPSTQDASTTMQMAPATTTQNSSGSASGLPQSVVVTIVFIIIIGAATIAIIVGTKVGLEWWKRRKIKTTSRPKMEKVYGEIVSVDSSSSSSSSEEGDSESGDSEEVITIVPSFVITHEEVYNSQEVGGVTIVYSQEEDSDSDSEDGTAVHSQDFLETPQVQRDSLLQKPEQEEYSDSEEEGSTVYSLQQQNLQEEATTVQEEKQS